jgi:hypothetical protein
VPAGACASDASARAGDDPTAFGPEALARGTRSLINRAEESSLKRLEGMVRGKETKAAVFANDDTRRSAANLDDVG